MAARAWRDPDGTGWAGRPSRGLGEWIRAWRTVLRDPDRPMPDPGLPSEGEPIPVDMGLRCPECGYQIGGLTEWRCPECGERFTVQRAYTLRMLQEPEYFLRYRVGVEDIRRTLWALILFAGGLVLVLAATVVMVLRGDSGMLPISVAYYTMSGFLALTILPVVGLYFLLDLPLPRILFFFAIPWFLLCLGLFALAWL